MKAGAKKTGATRIIAPTAAVAALLLLAGPAFAGEGLVAPFDVPPPGQSARVGDCEAPPRPIRSLTTESIYEKGDPTHSTIDEEAKERYDDTMQPVREFGNGLTRMANRYLRSDGGDTGSAGCVVTWMAAWARADALTDIGSRQTALSLTRVLAGVALAYLEVATANGIDEADRAAIVPWLEKLGHLTTSVFDGERDSDLGNHRYWGGLAAATVAIATRDRALFDWAMDSYRLGICQVDSDGALPIELSRGPRARDYHIHALAPLVMLAEIGARNGVDTYGECSDSLKRLVAFVLHAIDDPSEIESLAGARQLPLQQSSSRLAWVAIYRSRFPLPVDVALPEKMSSSPLGGNMQLLYGGS